MLRRIDRRRSSTVVLLCQKLYSGAVGGGMREDTGSCLWLLLTVPVHLKIYSDIIKSLCGVPIVAVVSRIRLTVKVVQKRLRPLLQRMFNKEQQSPFSCVSHSLFYYYVQLTI